ncbi:MAG TPA: hypothetical protein VD907_01265 [Verrucomicrobiae bacterium]|nr:hypothetical protein [Verrucomicrobiae bacterium]
MNQLDTARETGFFLVETDVGGERYRFIIASGVSSQRSVVYVVSNHPELEKGTHQHIVNRCEEHKGKPGGRRIIKPGEQLCLGFTGAIEGGGKHVGIVKSITQQSGIKLEGDRLVIKNPHHPLSSRVS